MAIIVQKFGGTSLANVKFIQNAAQRVKHEFDLGNQVIVVVSAMAGVTDQLINWARNISVTNQAESEAEYDNVVSSGEQVTSGLLALTLQSMGIKARSWQGWQLPIVTDNHYGKAKIISINVSHLKRSLEQGEVAVIAGFQGINQINRITTLGRGGSDTTAMAVAASIKADRCDIFTDVDGIYTADPRIVDKACKLDVISYAEMLEMASLGAKVLQTRSVEVAMKHQLLVQVLSSFTNIEGTLVKDKDKKMEKKLITGIACNRNDCNITVSNLSNDPQMLALVFTGLADSYIDIDMISQQVVEGKSLMNLSFTTDKNSSDKVVTVLKNLSSIDSDNISINNEVAKISIVGVGMRTQSDVIATIFKTLALENIETLNISITEIKISILIASKYMEDAVRLLHTSLKLDNDLT